VNGCGKIMAISATELAVPLPAPVRNGTALITERRYILVDVETDDGMVGTSCVFTRGAPLVALVRDVIGPQLIGRFPEDVSEIWSDIYRAGELFLGRSGAFPRALSVVDIALWDLRGKVQELPVADLLGRQRESVPLLMALGYYRGGDDELESLEAEYAALVTAGFRRFKMMAGGAPVDRDVERIAAIAGVLPSDATLAVDVNGAWSTADEALRFVEASPVSFEFIEDPFRPDNIEALREFRANCSVPLAIGEWESGRYRFSQLVEGQLVDILRIDATAAGGITEWLRIAEHADEHGARILPHYYPEVHIHLALSNPTVEAIEVVPTSTGADNFPLLTTAVPWQESPVSHLAPGSGLGVEWDRDAVERFRVDGQNSRSS